MSDVPPMASPTPELWSLLQSRCDGTMTPDQWTRLNQLLRDDPDARQLYVFHMDQHASLLWRFRDGLAAPVGQDDLQYSDRSPAPPLAVSYPLPALSGYLASGWPVAYLISTVVLSIGLAIAAIVHVSQPEQYVGPTAPVRAPDPESPSPNPSSVVGRVTAMVDCVWEQEGLPSPVYGRGAGGEGDSDSLAAATSRHANHPSEIRNQKSLLHLGDRLALRSGLLEITYDTGAKVILQGPVTYQVESPAGGYLAIGKLTARLDSHSEVSHLTSQISNHQFAVRTPTAVVTDLGTEFGVEVDKNGGTTSHVFRGSVRVRSVLSDAKNVNAGVLLREGDAARVEKADKDRTVAVSHPIRKPETFIRQMPPPPKSSPLQVLARFRLGEDDPGAIAGAPTNPQTINHSGGRHLARQGSPKYTSETAAPDSRLSVRFQGEAGECLGTSDIRYIVSDNVILEAWARLNKAESYSQFVVYNGDGHKNGYGLVARDGRWQYLFGGIVQGDVGVPCELGKWTHLALVCEQGKMRMWINGRPVGAPHDGFPNAPNGTLAIGGDYFNPPLAFNGAIDEVRLSKFQPPFSPTMLLCAPPAKAAPNADQKTEKRQSPL